MQALFLGFDMQLDRSDWNVVVVGAWNRSLFTPDRVRRHVLGLESPAKLAVQVVLDFDEPPRISYENLVISADTRQLLVTTGVPTFESLHEAMRCASRAVSWLPETPFRAVGINVRLKVPLPSPAITKHLASDLDFPLSDTGYEIAQRSSTRMLRRSDGSVVNVGIATAGDENALIEINFHSEASAASEITQFLACDIDRFRRETSDLYSLITGQKLTEALDGD